MTSIFISHSSKDEWLIKPIANNMRSLGIEPYLAELDIPNPTSLPQKIEKAIDSSSAMFVILSSNVSNIPKTRDVVNWEIAIAHAKNKPIYVFAEKDVDIPLMVNYITVYARYDPLSQDSLNEIVNKIHQTASSLKQADDQIKGIGTFIMIVLGILGIGALAQSK